MALSSVAVVVSAALDTRLGEPPTRWHPVVWFGTYLRVVGDRVPARPPWRARLLGGVGWLGGLTLACGAGVIAHRVVGRLPSWLGPVVSGLLLWPLWSGRLLLSEVEAVATALDGSGTPDESIAAGRLALSRIVSRETGDLSRHEIAASAIESLAENLSDSVVAPLLWFVVAGLPGAAAYRFVNTADACWGYRTDRWQHAGTVAARADDVANLVASRMSGAAILVGRHWHEWRTWPIEARRTPSPNSGWPMAAMALRLDRRLTKPGVYTLHPGGRAPDASDIHRALAICRPIITATVAAAAALTLITHRRPRGAQCAR